MQLVQHNRFGPPPEVLEFSVSELPPPADDELTIAVEATPIHAGDLQNIAGEKTMFRTVTPGETLNVELPQVPGIEGIGRVKAKGGAVSEFDLGDRVYLPFQCGSWRSEVNAKAADVFPAPEGDPVHLCLIINALTAEVALQDLGPVQEGEWFVQNSANSNVGRDLIVLAKRHGIKTLNIVRRESLVAELTELGADVVLVDGPGLPQRVRDATAGAQLAVGLDGIGGAASGRLAECLSDQASVFNMGSMSGEDSRMPNWVLLYKQVALRGFYAGFNLTARSAEQRRDMVAELADLISHGVLRAKIAATYPLTACKEAAAHAMKSGAERDGKVVFDLRL